MALSMTGYENSAGVKVEYWRIGNFSFSQSHKFVDIQVFGYVCQQCRDDGKDQVETVRTRVVYADFDPYFSPAAMDAAGQNIVAIIYKYLKEKEGFFKNAIDV